MSSFTCDVKLTSVHLDWLVLICPCLVLPLRFSCWPLLAKARRRLLNIRDEQAVEKNVFMIFKYKGFCITQTAYTGKTPLKGIGITNKQRWKYAFKATTLVQKKVQYSVNYLYQSCGPQIRP
jgi:hypothetical protein